MADLFVTLISVQPAVAVRPLAQTQPQPPADMYGGAYDTKRQMQVTQAKVNPPGIK